MDLQAFFQQSRDLCLSPSFIVVAMVICIYFIVDRQRNKKRNEIEKQKLAEIEKNMEPFKIRHKYFGSLTEGHGTGFFLILSADPCNREKTAHIYTKASEIFIKKHFSSDIINGEMPSSHYHQEDGLLGMVIGIGHPIPLPEVGGLVATEP